MTRLVYRARARKDLAEILRYITLEAGLGVGVKFVSRLRERCQRLAYLPGTLGTARPQLGEGLRSTPCEGYVIFFRYRDDAVEIVNILHASRDVEGYFSE